MSQFDTFLFDTELFDDPGDVPSGYTTVIVTEYVYTARINTGGQPTESNPNMQTL